MALERSVMMGDGVVRRFHIISSIEHIFNSVTYIEVVSYEYNNEMNNSADGCHTTLTLEFDDTLTFEKAYEYVTNLSEFTEYKSDSDEELIDMNARIQNLTEELANTQQQVDNLNAEVTTTTGKLTNVLNVLTDDQALEFAIYYSEWVADKNYVINDRVIYDGNLYKCVQSHTSLDTWTPDATPALWTKVAPPNVIAEWIQPTGAQDAYQTGDKVLHNNSVWVSTADNNVWEPSVYGWEIFSE